LFIKNNLPKKTKKEKLKPKGKLKKANQQSGLSKDIIDNKIISEENYNQDTNEENKYTKNTKLTTTEHKETINSSFMLLSHKENNLNINLNKNTSDNLFITNFKDSYENKFATNLLSSHYKSNKPQLNNSALNNSISQQNLNTLMNESTNNVCLNKDGVSNFSASPKIGNKNILISSIQKVNNRPLSPSNNQINISKNLNNNFNVINPNYQNYDFQNTSISSNASVFINKSFRNFNNTNSNMINRPQSLINRYDNLFPTRVFSGNNLNQNNLNR